MAAGLWRNGSIACVITRRRVESPLDRLSEGLRGDWRNVGGAVGELRIHHGPGYRLYYAEEGGGSILLLCGGTKDSQKKDIEKAHAYWEDFQARSR